MTAARPGDGAQSLYVHVPFCARRCTYCDFDFEVGRHPATDRFVAGLARELAARGGEIAAGVRTLYFGGGTPSLLGADGLRSTARLLAPWIDRDRLEEFTVELNPEHVDGALLDALVEIGAGRVSLGVQSFESDALRQLGRAHDPDVAERAARSCVARGLATSVDLIVGWPGQDRAALDRDLQRAIDLGVGHLSIYALTIEAGASWPKLVRRGLRQLPDDDAQAWALERVASRLGDAGFEHYEIASYAREGRHARHNGVYWAWTDYVGVGPSAASARYGADGAVMRRTNPRGLGPWCDQARPEVEHLGPVDAAAEGLWLALRTAAGVDVDRFLARFGAVDAAWLDARVAVRVDRGDLEWHGRWLRTAPGRWLILDAIAADLLGSGPAAPAC